MHGNLFSVVPELEVFICNKYCHGKYRSFGQLSEFDVAFKSLVTLFQSEVRVSSSNYLTLFYVTSSSFTLIEFRLGHVKSFELISRK